MNDETSHTEEPRDLSPQEREAFEKLPREKEPGDLLEERVVRSLKREGLLGKGARSPRTDRHFPWNAAWVAGAAAAALALFLSGLVVGQWMGARTATGAFLAIQEQEQAEAADRVQAAGSEYVRVLARFAEESPQGSRDEVAQGRQAAMGALLAATEILIRLEPEDPALTSLLRYLEERWSGPPGDTTTTRQTYWF